MKRIVQFLFSLVVLCALLTMAAGQLRTEYSIHPAITVALLLGVILFSKSNIVPGVHLNAAIEVSRWKDYIVKRFWKDNQFLKYWKNADEYVEGGKTVVIPQPGAKPTVNKNPTVFPLAAVRRTDTAISYDLDWYITSPTQVTNAEKAEISYDKMDDVMGDHVGVQNDRAADELLIKALTGLPGANVVYTTGGGGAGAVVIDSAEEGVTGQTGNRYGCHYKDVKKVITKMRKGNLPKSDLYCIMDEDMMKQFTDSLSESQSNAFNQFYNESTGVMGKLYGCTFFSRSSVAVAAAALSGGNLDVNAYGAAVDATDCLVSLFWHKNSLERAMGEINVMHNEQRAEYGGDIMNCDFRFGGRRTFENSDGVFALVQAAAA